MKPASLPNLLALLLAIALGVPLAKADLLLDLIPDTTWDRSSDPIASAFINFRISLDPLAPNANQLNAFSVGIRIVPTAGATGSLAIQNVAIPDNDAVFNLFAIPPVLANLGGGHQTVSGENAVFADVTIPQAGRALFKAQFFSPGNDAAGLFEVYADRETTNYFVTTEFDGLKFSNVPSAGDPMGVLLGSIQVNITAVPEPSSAVLACATLCVLAFSRRRCNQHLKLRL